MTTLLLSSRHSEDDQALWRAAIGRGWSVARARGLRLPEIDDAEVVMYLEALFAPAIAKLIGRELPEPAEDWLVRLPDEFRKRSISLATLANARQMARPAFVKPPNDKSFEAKVYQSGSELPTDFDDNMSVLVADPVQWESEFRCFCLDGQVRTVSPYLRHGILARANDYVAPQTELEEAGQFTESVLTAVGSNTPRAVVVDVGQINGQGWAVVEANAAWGSGIYGCNPDAVLDVIRHATLNPGEGG